MTDIIQRIKELKKQRNAVIIAHNYQIPEIQDIADITGDSLELSRKSAEVKEDVIVFCGVRFMAETAKILSPDKTVLLPVDSAGCEMADMASIEVLKAMKEEHPDAAVVCYVNTTADIKSLSDICCTSANAVKVVNSLPNEKIIFVPDRNLASYVQKNTDKQIIPYPGYCYVHNNFTVRDVEIAKKLHPEAVLFVHPEAQSEVADMADYVLSTGGMLKIAHEMDKKEIIIGTEEGLMHRLRKENPDKLFYALRNEPPAVCINMKKTGMNDLLASLEHMQYEVQLEESIRLKAASAIRNMLSVR